MNKKIYKTETHMHLSESSPCSHVCAKDMVKLYADAGYSTLFVTDHLTENVLEKLGATSFIEGIDLFLRGYEAALEEGNRIGVRVLLAAELSLNDNPFNHYLLYGVDKKFLALRDDIFNMTPDELHEHARLNGVTVIQAHPYRDGKSVPVPHAVDAFEAYNTCPRHNNFTDETIALAKEHGLPITCGSDSHRPEDVALGGVATEFEIKSAEDYISALFENKTVPISHLI